MRAKGLGTSEAQQSYPGRSIPAMEDRHREDRT
jgi:hypothetical protein